MDSFEFMAIYVDYAQIVAFGAYHVHWIDHPHPIEYTSLSHSHHSGSDE